MCRFSRFNLRKDGDAAFGFAESSVFDTSKPKHGKMEYSVINFAAEYDWRPDDVNESEYISTIVDSDCIPIDSAQFDRSGDRMISILRKS